jgi:hypothetical protein
MASFGGSRAARGLHEWRANVASYMTPAPKSPYAHCRKWRMADAAVCKGPGPSPASFDPCHCMCDLCAGNSDCVNGEGGVCLELATTMSGGSPAKVCVYKDNACHPNHRPRCRTGCINLWGTAECRSK